MDGTNNIIIIIIIAAAETIVCLDGGCTQTHSSISNLYDDTLSASHAAVSQTGCFPRLRYILLLSGKDGNGK